MTRKRVIAIAAAAVLIALVVFGIVLSRQRVRRNRVFRTGTGEVKPAPPVGVPPVEQWTAHFEQLAPDDLTDLLDEIEERNPNQYKQWSLAYLHARALIEENEPARAAEKLAPFLAANHPLRDLALYHQSEIQDAQNQPQLASRSRQEVIFRYPQSVYRDVAMEEETEYLSSLSDTKPLLAFAIRLHPSSNASRRRDLDARLIETLIRQNEPDKALQNGLTLLRAGQTDDASDRVSRAIDRPELLARMNKEQLAMMGETLRSHRHFDRAVAVLGMALRAIPPPAAPVAAPPVKTAAPAAKTAKAPAKKPVVKTARTAKPAPKKPAAKKPAAAKPAAPKPAAAPPASKWDELQFSLGRSYFGNEKFVEAQQTYERGAALTRDPRMKATFFFHASRAAQLRGDDATAERLMTAAIAVPGRFPATTAALTQRIRTRVKQKQFPAAASDLAQVRRLAPNDRAVLDAALAYGIGVLGGNNPSGALAAFNSIPAALADPYDDAELAYWRARSLESSNPPAAFAEYLKVLRSATPSHFAYFARQRLDAPAMAPKLAQELAARDAQATKLIEAKQFDEAKRVLTDRILLSSANRAAALQRLSAVYRELPAYRTILELKPVELPRLPLKDSADRGTLLVALGLADEAVDTIEARYGLRPASAALTRSLALNRGAASKESIYAVEILMKQVPADYVPDLLPRVVRELLYPRYFDEFIQADAKRFESDPTLVLSIMREESRFNPRAKSEAAARGLLQFIITTARDIGRNVGLVDVAPEDLYDPRIIIRLGAKYVAELGQQLGGNRYRIAAAYNAGPKQVALWQRMQPAPGDDYFLSSVNFDETKHYVRKVMNSYERYRELYGNGAPAGGLQIEP